MTHFQLRSWVAGDRAAKSLPLTCSNVTKKTALYEEAVCSPALLLYSTDASHMYLCAVPTTVDYSGGEWVQIATEPRGIWQGAPCLPAN